MVDPVLAPDGYTYEREFLEDWIGRTGISPMTRQPIRVDALIPNRALFDIIEEIRRSDQVGIKAIYHDGKWNQENVSSINLISNKFAQLIYSRTRVHKVHAADLRFLLAGSIKFATELEEDYIYTVIFHDGAWKRTGAHTADGVNRKYAQIVIHNVKKEVLLAHAANFKFLFSGVVEKLL